MNTKGCTFIFQAHADKSVSLTYDPPLPPGKKPKSSKLGKQQPVGFRLVPPPGTSEQMLSISLAFTPMTPDSPNSPFGDGAQSNFTWHAGGAPTQAINAYGIWDFGGKMMAASGAVYTLKDPELQVGDGPDMGGGHG